MTEQTAFNSHESSPVPGLQTLLRRYPRGTELGLHSHKEAQLLFAPQGLMQVTTPKGRWLVPPHRAVWIPPLMEHSIYALADIEMRSLYVESEWLCSHTASPGLLREFVIVVGPLLRSLVLALFDLPRNIERADLLARLVLFELAESEDATTFMPLPTDARARHVAELAQVDVRCTRDLEALARDAGASTRTITRLFISETGLTFKAWRQRARIMAAVVALSAPRTSVKQVAIGLGFSSVSAFGYAFRQVIGCTPSEYMSRAAFAT